MNNSLHLNYRVAFGKILSQSAKKKRERDFQKERYKHTRNYRINNK